MRAFGRRTCRRLGRCATASALALMHREKTGEGQEVSTSLLHMSMAMQAVDLVRADSEVESGGESGEDYANQPLYLPYGCSDGQWVNIVVISDKEFRGLCKALRNNARSG